ncbi:hypothetical protein [Aeromonas media]|uniref:hypothetical protein n=1 Tax=Aeromonas media TaxID=651 RepID=UPI003CFF295E
MIDFQSVFYGVCGLLAAIAITQPKFYVKYAGHLFVAAFVNMALVLVVTYFALVIANDAGEYRDGINLFARYFSEFLFKVDNYQTVSYMALLFVVWINLLFLSKLMSKYDDEIKKENN